jgi:hypothetical protein
LERRDGGEEMRKDRLSVETDQLRALARVYDAQAYRLAGAVAVFSTVARPPADAFGILGPAHDAHTSYLRSVGQAVESLNQAVYELRRRRDALFVGAARWEAADEASRL